MDIKITCTDLKEFNMEHPKKLRTFADEYSTVGVSAAFFSDVSQQSKTGHGSGARDEVRLSISSCECKKAFLIIILLCLI